MLYCQIMYNFGFPRYDLLYCETSSREGLKYMFSLPENLTTEKVSLCNKLILSANIFVQCHFFYHILLLLVNADLGC